jgi:hypothetical protein
MLKAVDAEDGVLEGQITPAAGAVEDFRTCDRCQHFNAIGLKKCQSCGALFGPR